MNNCPYCDQPLVESYQGRNDILICGEYPDRFDTNKGVPFTGEAGDILRFELSRLGMNMYDCSLANLWLHDKNKDERCFQMGVETLTREMAGRRVLLMGAELSKYFLNESVLDVAGLVVESPLFLKSVKWVMIAPAPGIALHQPHGEMRLAISKFVSKIKEEG